MRCRNNSYLAPSYIVLTWRVSKGHDEGPLTLRYTAIESVTKPVETSCERQLAGVRCRCHERPRQTMIGTRPCKRLLINHRACMAFPEAFADDLKHCCIRCHVQMRKVRRKCVVVSFAVGASLGSCPLDFRGPQPLRRRLRDVAPLFWQSNRAYNLKTKVCPVT